LDGLITTSCLALRTVVSMARYPFETNNVITFGA
jgi:hypothetical protein